MRITTQMLENKVNYLNDLTNNAREPYKFGKGSNIGTYYISKANGGYQLEQIVNSGGGARNILNTGRTTKKDLYNNINSFLLGIELAKKVNQ